MILMDIYKIIKRWYQNSNSILISWINTITSKATNMQELLSKIFRKICRSILCSKSSRGIIQFQTDYFKKNNNRDVSSLIGPIIERYEVFLLPVVKNLLLQVLFFLLSLIVNLILWITQHFYYRFWNISLAISVFMICNSYLKFSHLKIRIWLENYRIKPLSFSIV